jgi:CO/xanthine dehydrogenase FAD-binding subunit
MAVCEEYLQPLSVEEALAALKSASGPAAIVAGGTDLLLDLRQGRHPPVHTLVDVSAIPEMQAIRREGEHIFIGGAVTINSLLQHPLLLEHARCLVEACGLIGGPQVRNVATIGGNVAHALPAGDGTIALLSLDAEAQIVSQEAGRWEPLGELFEGPGKTAFDRGCEILVGFRIPRLNASEGTCFQRVMRPQGVAIAILNMSVWLRTSDDESIEDIRLTVGPAGPVPFRARQTEAALRGQIPQTRSIQTALDVLLAEARLRTSPHRATKEYRQLVLGVLLNRTLKIAYQRALENEAVIK